MRRSDFSLLAQAGAELATLLELTYPIDKMWDTDPEAVAVVTEICWRLEEVDEGVPNEIAHLVCSLAGQGNTIPELRRERRMSRKYLAEQIGTSESLIKRIELRKAFPGHDMAQHIAEVFDKRIEEVFPALIAWKGRPPN